MTIRIGSNNLSLTVQRNLFRSNRDLSNASERLASGQRINKASDDAAGLAISMDLDNDLRLTRTAQRNVSDAISMISIMSAGLSSQKEILTRMTELAEQSANGTYSNQQREALQKEYTSLMDEFDRIGETTEFNGIKLLRNRDGQTIQAMAGITGADTSLLQIAAINSHRYSGEYGFVSNYNADSSINFTDFGINRDYLEGDYSAMSISIQERLPQMGFIQIKDSNGEDIELQLMPSRFTTDFGQPLPVPSSVPTLQMTYLARNSSGDTSDMGFTSVNYSRLATSVVVVGTMNTSGATFTHTIDLSGISYTSYDAAAPIPAPSAIGFTNIKRQIDARKALETITRRADALSKIQGQIGAVESRLQVAHNLLSTSGENFAAASSRIKDTDFAAETAEVVRNRILQQTSASLLGQANLAPQIALNLLQNL